MMVSSPRYGLILSNRSLGYIVVSTGIICFIIVLLFYNKVYILASIFITRSSSSEIPTNCMLILFIFYCRILLLVNRKVYSAKPKPTASIFILPVLFFLHLVFRNGLFSMQG